MRALFFLMLFMLISGTAYARIHQIDMETLAKIESSNNPKACSYKGCKYGRGLYQISEIALAHYNQDNRPEVTTAQLLDSGTNRMVANWYLDYLWKWCAKRPECETREDVLIAWNWGMGNLLRWKWGDRPDGLPKETKDFIKRYKRLSR